MCWGLMLGQGSEFQGWLQGWLNLLHFHYFIFLFSSDFVCFLSLCESLFHCVSALSFSSFLIIALIHLYLCLSSLLHLLSLSLVFHFYSLLLLSCPLLPSILHSSEPGLPEPYTFAVMAPLLLTVSLVPLTPHTASIPPKTTSNGQRHQSRTVSQPGSQSASQPAFCFDLKLLSSQSQGCFPLLIHIKDPLKLLKFAV